MGNKLLYRRDEVKTSISAFRAAIYDFCEGRVEENHGYVIVETKPQHIPLLRAFLQNRYNLQNSPVA